MNSSAKRTRKRDLLKWIRDWVMDSVERIGERSWDLQLMNVNRIVSIEVGLVH